MTGYPDENRPAFKRAAAMLRKQGYAVTSPDELDATCPAMVDTWEGLMARDLPWLAAADVGFALPGWRNSKGATLEACILGQLKRPVFALSQDLQLATPVPPDTLPQITHP